VKNQSDKNNALFCCLQCGECCGAWNLPIEKDLFERLIKNEWIQARLKETDTAFQDIDGDIYLPKVKGICVFHNPQNKLCEIHQYLGEELKPIECQRSPFAFAKDKEGRLYIDTSFYCKAIVEGQQIQQNFELNETFLKKFDVFEFPDQILLTPGVLIPYQDLLALRSFICDYIYDSCIDKPLADWHETFLLIYKSLTEVEKQLKVSSQKSPPLEILKEKLAPSYLIKLYKEKHSLLEALFLRKQRIFPDSIKIYCKKGVLKEPIISEELNLEKISKLKYPPDKTINHALLRYTLNIISRNILYAHGHSFKGIYTAAYLAYVLANWYARALTCVDQCEEVDLFHQLLAIRITERYYIGHNVKFMELFRQPAHLKKLHFILTTNII
jgi:Fe-S-cluster containining protein